MRHKTWKIFPLLAKLQFSASSRFVFWGWCTTNFLTFEYFISSNFYSFLSSAAQPERDRGKIIFWDRGSSKNRHFLLFKQDFSINFRSFIKYINILEDYLNKNHLYNFFNFPFHSKLVFMIHWYIQWSPTHLFHHPLHPPYSDVATIWISNFPDNVIPYFFMFSTHKHALENSTSLKFLKK